MSEQTYSIIAVDGQKYESIEYELVREWYAARLVNEESLIFSAQVGSWKKLMNVFNLAELNAARNLVTQWELKSQAENTQQPISDNRRKTDDRQNLNDHQKNLIQQNNQNRLPARTASQSFGQQQNYQAAAGTGQRERPPRREFDTDSSGQKSSGLKTVLIIAAVVTVVFGGLAGVGGYFFAKIAGKQLAQKSSSAGMEKFLADLKKYEIPGSEYADEQSGVKIRLPKDWRMLKPDNPMILIHNRDEISQSAKKDGLSETMMLATDKLGNGVLLAEIIGFPKQINGVTFFNQSVDLVEKEMTAQSVAGTYKRINDMTIPLDNFMAKKIIFERVVQVRNPRMEEYGISNNEQTTKGEIIVVTNGSYAVILQMWTKKEHFDEVVGDFDFIERNFSVPKQAL